MATIAALKSFIVQAPVFTKYNWAEITC